MKSCVCGHATVLPGHASLQQRRQGRERRTWGLGDAHAGAMVWSLWSLCPLVTLLVSLSSRQCWALTRAHQHNKKHSIALEGTGRQTWEGSRIPVTVCDSGHSVH